MLYRRFSDAFGERVALPHVGGTYALFPSPETILELSPDDFCATGMAFKRPGLTAAARAYLTHRAGRQELTPLGLIEALRTIPHVGEWTACAAVTLLTLAWGARHGAITAGERPGRASPRPRRSRKSPRHAPRAFGSTSRTDAVSRSWGPDHETA